MSSRTDEDLALERADDFVQSWKDSQLRWRCPRCGKPEVFPIVYHGTYVCRSCAWPRKVRVFPHGRVRT